MVSRDVHMTVSMSWKINFLSITMQGVATNAKLNDITNVVVQNTEQLCQCGLSAEVTFRARMRGTAQATSSQLLRNIETWVAQVDSTIAIQGVCVHVDDSCLLAISTFSDPECTTVAPTSIFDNVALFAGTIAGGVVIVLVALAMTIIAIAICVIKKRKAEQDVR